MSRVKWLAGALVLALAAGAFGVTAYAEQQQRGGGGTGGGAGTAGQPTMMQRASWRARGIKTAPLKLRVVDATSMKGIPGAGCVVAETKQRVETDKEGNAPAFDAPVYRNPRLEDLLAELHGQLNVICYKSGYRDAVYMGVRMHAGETTETEVWMYPYGVQDRRIEPTLYQVPVHRIWIIQLADQFRLRDEGEGPERPALNNPDLGPAPQETQGGGLQTPFRVLTPPPTMPPS